MRIGAIACAVLGGLGLLVAGFNVFAGPNRPADPDKLVGYAVGSFLVPIGLLVFGLFLWGKANPVQQAGTNRDEDSTEQEPFHN